MTNKELTQIAESIFDFYQRYSWARIYQSQRAELVSEAVAIASKSGSSGRDCCTARISAFLRQIMRGNNARY
jgi:hypothetical protein